MIKELLVGNLKIKATALFLAVLLWFSIDRELTMSITLRVPLEVTPPEGFMVMRQSDPAVPGVPPVALVEVQISGPRGRVERLTSSSLPCKHRVTRVPTPGVAFTEALTSSDFPLPPDAKLVLVRPAELELELDRIESVKMKVDPDCVEGTPAAGFRIAGPVSITPNRVTIRGPRALLEKHRDDPIRLLPVRLKEGLTDQDSPIEEIGRIAPALEGVLIQCEDRIEVRVLIEPVPERTTVVVPIDVVLPSDFPWVAVVNPGTLQITCEGAKSAVARLRPAHLAAFVKPFEDRSWTQAKPPDLLSCRPRVILTRGAPEGIRIVGEPADVAVSLAERQ